MIILAGETGYDKLFLEMSEILTQAIAYMKVQFLSIWILLLWASCDDYLDEERFENRVFSRIAKLGKESYGINLVLFEKIPQVVIFRYFRSLSLRCGQFGLTNHFGEND